MTLARLTAGDVGEIVSVFADAFRDYPVMRHTFGVRQPYGGGLPRPVELFVSARVLLEAVHALSDDDEGSGGVSLTTEVHANVALYQHFGYRVHGHARLAHGFETWTLFRPSASTDSQ